MKYLKVHKSTLKNGTVFWHLSTGNLSMQGSRIHRFELARKLIENMAVTVNKKRYEIHETTFRKNGKTVYIVCINRNNKPEYLLYYNDYHEKWEVESSCIVDEDIPLFEKYGYEKCED